MRLFVVACWVGRTARAMASPPPHPAAVGDDSVSVPVVSSSNPTSNVASAVTRLGSVFRRAISPQISQTQHTTQLEAIPRMQPQTSSQSLNQGGNPAMSESANSAEAVLPQPPLPRVPEQQSSAYASCTRYPRPSIWGDTCRCATGGEYGMWRSGITSHHFV